MLTIIDKAITAVIVPGITYLITQALPGVELSPEFSAGLATIIGAIFVYIIPNKPAA